MTKIGAARTATKTPTPDRVETARPKVRTSAPSSAKAPAETTQDAPRAQISETTRAETRSRVSNDAQAQQLRARAERVANGDAPLAAARTVGARRRPFRTDSALQASTAPQASNAQASGAQAAPGPVAQAGTPAAGSAEGFTVAPDGSQVFTGTEGDDTYTVSQNAGGDLVVRNEGSGTDFTLAAADISSGVTLQGLGGDDRFTVEDSVRADLTIRGGSGEDEIDGRLARGNLTLHGGSGDDVLRGGRRDDQIRGGLGNDRIYGGDGDDQLHGNGGDDVVFGGLGDDQLIGHSGDDSLNGGGGDDFIMGRTGADRLSGGTGSDNIYADADDTRIAAGSTYDPAAGGITDDGAVDLIVAEDGAPATRGAGTEDVTVNYDRQAVDDYLRAHPELQAGTSGDDLSFRERIRADIGAMLSTPEGRGLLDDLTAAAAAAGETITLTELEGRPGGTYNRGTNVATSGSWAATYRDGANRHPLPVLYHELVHAYQDLVSGFPAGDTNFGNNAAGNPVNIPNREREATGLPWMDSTGTVRGGNELPYTDNAFRRALGLPERSSYGGESGAPQGFVP